MEDSELYARGIEELHRNGRLLFELVVQWYTFFWTLNVACLAWFYSKDNSANTQAHMRSTISYSFIALNVLAVIIATTSAVQARRIWKSVMELHGKLICDLDTLTMFNKPPISDCYAYVVFGGMGLSNIVLICVWWQRRE